MRLRMMAVVLTLLLATFGLQAQNQKRIKTIDITVAIPQPETNAMESPQITAITTDVFGSQNMLGEGEGKIEGGSVSVYRYDMLGQLEHLGCDDKYESGREYMLEVHVTNYTDVLFNYKNDKNFTVDDTMVKATVNGKPAKIHVASGRPLSCRIVFKMPGERNPWLVRTTASAADGDHNGHGYVDLGLPSGTLWATCNVGATKPEAYGNYYAYGETKPKKSYNSENFIGYGAYTETNPYNIQGFDEEDIKYSVRTSKGRRLKPEYDAAIQNWGGGWKTPTRLQTQELCENCYAKFVVLNGVKGTLWTSLKNGKSIFTPYAGLQSEEEKDFNIGIAGYYQTANSRRHMHMYCYIWGSLYAKDDISKICLLQTSTGAGSEDELGNPTGRGYSVRAVWGGKTFDGDKEKTESDTRSKGSSGNDGEKKSQKKGGLKNKMKGLLNAGKGMLNILR